MSKAEDRYLEHFQDGRLINCSIKESFMFGYHQAEKDNELTWEDIDWIVGEAVFRVSEDSDKEQICKEVLKLFKDFKERKVEEI